MRGDLDWIVMKALAKERQRRYDSPLALAHDIERFEGHEPVTAGPPTASYRFRKFVRRNRGRVVAASLVMVALIIGIVGTTLGLIEANEQKRIALLQEKETKKRLRQRDKANAILLSIFKNLNPRGQEAADKPLEARLGERLGQASAELDGDAVDDRLGVARMQRVLGAALVELGDYDKAQLLLGKARGTLLRELGRDHDDTIECTSNLAAAYRAAGRFDRALPLMEEAFERAKTKRTGWTVASRSRPWPIWRSSTRRPTT